MRGWLTRKGLNPFDGPDPDLWVLIFGALFVAGVFFVVGRFA